MTTYYAIDHPARRILVRRVDGAVPERFDPATSGWTPKVDLLRYFLDGHEDGIREIGDQERAELERPAGPIVATLDGPGSVVDYRSRRE